MGRRSQRGVVSWCAQGKGSRRDAATGDSTLESWGLGAEQQLLVFLLGHGLAPSLPSKGQVSAAVGLWTFITTLQII